MNCPHRFDYAAPACAACVERENDYAAALRFVASCQHGAQGFLYRLSPNSMVGGEWLEWCPGCGSHRVQPNGPWIAPLIRGRR